MLDETSPELLAALKLAFANTEWQVETYHTGGGCFVARLHGAGTGAEIWLTREEDWFVGFYNFDQNEEDEGVVLTLSGFTYAGQSTLDDPAWVANRIHGLLERL